MVNHLLNHPLTNPYCSIDKTSESCEVVHIPTGDFKRDNNVLPTVTRCLRTHANLTTSERILIVSVLLRLLAKSIV